MKKILMFAAVLMFVSSTAYAGMGINVSKFSLDGMSPEHPLAAGIHYELNDTSAIRVNLGIANGVKEDADKMFNDIDFGLIYRMYRPKFKAVRPFFQGQLRVDNVTGDDMNFSLDGGIGGEWFYNDNISLEISTGLSFGMKTTPAVKEEAAVVAVKADYDPDTGLLKRPAVEGKDAVEAKDAETTNSFGTWTTSVGFNLYW